MGIWFPPLVISVKSEKKHNRQFHNVPTTYLLFILWTEMAGRFATSIRAKKLVLTHFSQRYKSVGNAEPTINVDESENVSKLVKQAEKTFTGCIIAADDFMVIQVLLKN